MGLFLCKECTPQVVGCTVYIPIAWNMALPGEEVRGDEERSAYVLGDAERGFALHCAGLRRGAGLGPGSPRLTTNAPGAPTLCVDGVLGRYTGNDRGRLVRVRGVYLEVRRRGSGVLDASGCLTL